ncbi:MAG TPA: VCBS repeat-containing protein [Isosphaeraceae bacterium]|nr:VCBS repeat-containing protein [Isosphaeraceae bacterium]
MLSLIHSPQRHFLFRNRGDGTFQDRTRVAGTLRGDARGMGIVAADLDGNGWTDLFVANHLCPNFLFLNRGDGIFEDAGERSGAACSRRARTRRAWAPTPRTSTATVFPSDS